MSVHTEFPTTSTQLAVQNEKRTKQLEAKAGSKTECRAADLWALFCRNGCRWWHNWQQEGETQLARSASEDLTKINIKNDENAIHLRCFFMMVDPKSEANANPPQRCQLWNPHHEVKHQRHQRCFWSIPCTGHWSPHLAPTIFRHPGGRSETPDIFQKGCCDRTAAKAIGRRPWWIILFRKQKHVKWSSFWGKTRKKKKKNIFRHQKKKWKAAKKTNCQWVCYPSTSIVDYPTSWKENTIC